MLNLIYSGKHLIEKVIFLLVVFSFLNGCVSTSKNLSPSRMDGIHVVDDKYGYRFKVPEGWRVIDQEYLDTKPGHLSAIKDTIKLRTIQNDGHPPRYLITVSLQEVYKKDMKYSGSQDSLVNIALIDTANNLERSGLTDGKCKINQFKRFQNGNIYYEQAGWSNLQYITVIEHLKSFVFIGIYYWGPQRKLNQDLPKYYELVESFEKV